MAAVASTETVKILINDIELTVPKGELIVESVKRLGLEIPIFCYHPRMKPVGMCRMCLVEVGFVQPDGSVRKMPKPQAACTLPASDGMAVYTDTEMVHRDRKGVLEFLLINHPLDCPICDRGGECPLQNNTLFYGPSTSRYIEIKRHLPKAFPLSKYVTLDLERCIQCGRCVRFTEEISGDSQLAFRFRGASMQPSTFELRDFQSKFSGNVIEICPVGALTSAEYRFRARPWDLETKPGVCTVCSNGCNIWFDYRAGKMVRINGRTNEQINEEWTCDRGKFGHEFYNADDRAQTVFVRRGEKLIESEWATAYGDLIDAFTQAKGKSAMLLGGSLSNEAYYLAQRMFRSHFASDNIDSRWTRVQVSASESITKKFGISPIQTPIADFEHKTNIFLFGTSLAEELPILFLRVRKAWFKNGAKVVVACDRDTDADSFAHIVLRYHPGTEAILAGGILAEALKSTKAKLPDGLEFEPSKFDLPSVEKATGVPADRIRETAKLIGESGAIVSSNKLLNTNDALACIYRLVGLSVISGSAFNCYPLNANDVGAALMGCLPDRGVGLTDVKSPGMSTSEILNACASGKIKALWLAGCDPFSLWHDQSEVEKALESVDFLVVQDTRENQATAYASVFLPMAAPAEDDGTYINMEGRAQRFKPILGVKGASKPAWRTFQEVSMRVKSQAPAFHPKDVMRLIGKEYAVLELADYDCLPDEGVVLRP